MRKLVSLMSAALLLGIIVVLSAAAKNPPGAIAKIKGGGTADFVDHDKALNKTGYTQFSVGVAVYADGTASGHFVCMIPSVVIVSLDVAFGTVNADGSVTVWGLAHGWDSSIPGPYTDLPVMVTFRDGGPGVGGFDYVDDSGFFEPDLFDREVVRRGQITIDP